MGNGITGNTDFENLLVLDDRVVTAIEFFIGHPETLRSITRCEWAESIDI